jgi:hypothetical protein
MAGLPCRGRRLVLSALNAPDCFSDGGRYLDQVAVVDPGD